MVKAIEWIDGVVRILDQTLLPVEIVYRECRNYREVAECIKTMRIRGAPAIGIAAAMGIALAGQDLQAQDGAAFRQKLKPAIDEMMSTRPTGVNIKWAMDRLGTMLDANREKGVAELK